MYECDPLHLNSDEIARVTNYIVVYTCKGNETIVEEMKQMKALILGLQDTTGTIKDVKKIAKKLLNKITKDKNSQNKNECVIWQNWIYFFALNPLRQSVYLVSIVSALQVNQNPLF